MIGDDFRVHWARVFLSLVFLMLMLVIVIVLDLRAIGVNGPYLCARYERDQRNRARNQS